MTMLSRAARYLAKMYLAGMTEAEAQHERQWAAEGWRQHWLQLWGFVGQQYQTECAIAALKTAIEETKEVIDQPVDMKRRNPTRPQAGDSKLEGLTVAALLLILGAIAAAFFLF